MFRKIRQAFNAATEYHRSMMDFYALPALWKKIRNATPDGDGHPVLILPGFLTNDAYTALLRGKLNEKGYAAHGWEGGFNLGLDNETAEHLAEQLERVFRESGNRKVTLVGYSLGGIYARELAREFPEMVRGVVTMGTPFGAMGNGATPEILRRIYEFFNPGTTHLDDAELARRALTPPPVPTTSIYSKSDGVVDWRASLNPQAPLTENIEVEASHMGMPFHALVLTALLDRLAQPEDVSVWKPFSPVDYAGFSYPDAAGGKDLPENPGWKPEPGKSGHFFRK